MTCHFMEDPLEAALVSCHVTDSQSGEMDEYSRLLESSIAYTRRKSPEEVFSVEQHSSKEEEKSTLKVELKPLPLISGRSSLTMIISSLLLSVLHLTTPNLKNCWACSESIGVPLIVVSRHQGT